MMVSKIRHWSLQGREDSRLVQRQLGFFRKNRTMARHGPLEIITMGKDNQRDERPQDPIEQVENQYPVKNDNHGKQPKTFSRRRVRYKPPEKATTLTLRPLIESYS